MWYIFQDISIKYFILQNSEILDEWMMKEVSKKFDSSDQIWLLSAQIFLKSKFLSMKSECSKSTDQSTFAKETFPKTGERLSVDIYV